MDRAEYTNRIGLLMNENELSQDAFAASINLNRDRVNNWLNGRSKLDVDSLKKISEKYNVSTDWVLGIAPIESRSPDTSVQGAAAVTGLSEESIDFLAYCKTHDGFSLSALNYLLGIVSDYWISASLATTQAISSMRVHMIDGEYDDADVFPILQDMISQLGSENVLHSESTFPSVPKGAILLSSNDACEYYKSKAVKVFSQYLDDYIDYMSNARYEKDGEQ